MTPNREGGFASRTAKAGSEKQPSARVKLLLDENLSPKLIRRLADVFPGSVHVHDCGLALPCPWELDLKFNWKLWIGNISERTR